MLYICLASGLSLLNKKFPTSLYLFWFLNSSNDLISASGPEDFSFNINLANVLTAIPHPADTSYLVLNFFSLLKSVDVGFISISKSSSSSPSRSIAALIIMYFIAVWYPTNVSKLLAACFFRYGVESFLPKSPTRPTIPDIILGEKNTAFNSLANLLSEVIAPLPVALFTNFAMFLYAFGFFSLVIPISS